METMFTPGPWSLPHFAKPDVNCECGYVLCDHMMGAVATVHCSGDGEDWQKHGDNPKFAEAVANAHLISASPDLYAALTEMVRVYWADGDGIDPPPACITQSLAALAKARGETP